MREEGRWNFHQMQVKFIMSPGWWNEHEQYKFMQIWREVSFLDGAKQDVLESFLFRMAAEEEEKLSAIKSGKLILNSLLCYGEHTKSLIYALCKLEIAFSLKFFFFLAIVAKFSILCRWFHSLYYSTAKSLIHSLTSMSCTRNEIKRVKRLNTTT